MSAKRAAKSGTESIDTGTSIGARQCLGAEELLDHLTQQQQPPPSPQSTTAGVVCNIDDATIAAMQDGVDSSSSSSVYEPTCGPTCDKGVDGALNNYEREAIRSSSGPLQQLPASVEVDQVNADDDDDDDSSVTSALTTDVVDEELTGSTRKSDDSLKAVVNINMPLPEQNTAEIASGSAENACTIHPFDMPCPFGTIGVQPPTERSKPPSLKGKDDTIVCELPELRRCHSETPTGSTIQSEKQKQDDKVPSPTYVIFDDNDTLLQKAPTGNLKTEAIDFPGVETKSDLDAKEGVPFLLDSHTSSEMDELMAEKHDCATPLHSAHLRNEEGEDNTYYEDDALRPPELCRQDAASGLVWSVSQPGAFRQGGSGDDDPEDDRDVWTVSQATRVVETPRPTIQDAHIIVHAAALVVDDHEDHPHHHHHDDEEQQRLHQRQNSIVFTEAIEIYAETQPTARSFWKFNRSVRQLRKLYAGFTCAIAIAIALTIFVTVTVVEQSSSSSSTSGQSQSAVTWPSSSPVATVAPTSPTELLIRSSSDSNDTSTARPNYFVPPSGPFAWSRLGEDVDGEYESETFGYSIALSAVSWILVIGSPWNKDSSHPGSLSVLQLMSGANNWTHLGSPILGKTDGGGFGWSVDISDSGFIVAGGAPWSAKGSVTVSRLTAMNHWQKMGDDLEGESEGDNFGIDVSLSGIGTVVAAGAPGYANGTGSVSVYQYVDSASAWKPMGSKILGNYPGQRSGGSVSLSLDGHTLAVGTTEHRCKRRTPHVRVFQWNNTDWSLMGDPIIGTSATDQCAMSVALSADGMTVAAGSWLSANHKNLMTGGVLLFRWYDNHWKQLGNDIYGDKEGDNFGVTVELSLDGNTLAVGSNFGGNNGSGSIKMFKYNITMEDWQQHGSTMNGETPGEQFGKAIAISPGGRVVAGGAYQYNLHGKEDVGQVRVVTSIGTG